MYKYTFTPIFYLILCLFTDTSNLIPTPQDALFLYFFSLFYITYPKAKIKLPYVIDV
jgi:hypothetical protein